MSRQRDPTFDSQTDSAADSAPRKRKDSGIGARGHGIKVEGDELFDPHRFQTFEVTPAFRQRILEAPLPLLELRDGFSDLAPQSQTQRRAGPNDTTQPELRRSGTAESSPRRPISQPIHLELPIPLTRPARRPTNRASLAMRIGLFAGAMALTFLGLAYTQSHGSRPVSKDDTRNTTQARVQALQIQPATMQSPASENSPSDEPVKTPTATPASSAMEASANLPNANKPSNKQPPVKKKLWLPAE